MLNNMSEMFHGCKSLTSVNFGNINTSEVEDMSGMFESCESLTELDLRSFDTSSVTNMSRMFAECTNLTVIKVTEGKWIIPNGCDTTAMFSTCGVSDVTYYPE